MTIAGSFLNGFERNSQCSCNAGKTRSSPNFIHIGSKLRVWQRFKESSRRELRNKPPCGMCGTTTPKYLSGQPLDRVWIKLARKGFCGTHTARSCGGLFGSSWLEWSPSALSFVRHFFTILTFLSEQCALTSWKLWQYSMLTPKSEISDYPLLQVNE